MPVEVFLPKMSDHMQSGVLLRWLVPEGAEVKARQAILEIETDKAVGEVEAPASGILLGVRAREGTEIPVGEVLAFIAQPGESVPFLGPLEKIPIDEKLAGSEHAPRRSAPEASEAQILAAPAARRVAKELGVDLSQVQGSGPGERIKEDDVRAYAEHACAVVQPTVAPERTPATPVARKIAREHGVDLGQVAGTGTGGRITQENVLSYLEHFRSQAAPQPAIPTDAETQGLAVSAEAEEHVVEMELSTIRRLTGERMTWSTQNIPHFVLSTDVDMTEACRLRETLTEPIHRNAGVRLSYTALLVHIVAYALTRHPLANAEFDGERIKIHRAVHIGVAVGTEEGLIVPVIRDADKKRLAQIAQELSTFLEKATTMRFSVSDLSGGTFTLSNLGMFGVERFNAIINPPQSAILAVGQIHKQPAGRPDGNIALRPIMNLSLSIDHRVMDGVAGAKFLAEIKSLLTNPFLLLEH